MLGKRQADGSPAFSNGVVASAAMNGAAIVTTAMMGQTGSSLGSPALASPANSDDLQSEIRRLTESNSLLMKKLHASEAEVMRLGSVIKTTEAEMAKKQKAEDKISRYWTNEEHQRFLDALQTVGPKDVKQIAAIVGTRSATQVRTHAQKYFIKLARMKKSAEERAKAGIEGAEEEAWWLAGTQSPASSKGSEVDSSTNSSKSGGKPANTQDSEETTSSSGKLSLTAKSSSLSKGSTEGTASSESKESGSKESSTHVNLSDLRTDGKGTGAKDLKGINLTSSSNEESGATDGSSTHGNGTSNGSCWGSNIGSVNSLNGSDGYNGSSNAPSNASDGSDGSNKDNGSEGNSRDGGSEGSENDPSEQDGAEDKATIDNLVG
eukprot:CAMPEP_0184300854 /NCGR_PEP_ID=MMETSP1049-20130417/11186_1 /TAXON_ID=77928 /ORGANISM="Proteomonas sulcata, Strain CCMP704" /LENGTH=377 /DNA_ID=CAMNT_0026611689 /DNA_START=102 /DNA_END=1235 /DNA_ORIENTATION=+